MFFRCVADPANLTSFLAESDHRFLATWLVPLTVRFQQKYNSWYQYVKHVIFANVHRISYTIFAATVAQAACPHYILVPHKSRVGLQRGNDESKLPSFFIKSSKLPISMIIKAVTASLSPASHHTGSGSGLLI